jgi:hypothetical protein
VILFGPDKTAYLRVSPQLNKEGRLLFILRDIHQQWPSAMEVPIEDLAELRDHLDKLLEGEIS